MIAYIGDLSARDAQVLRDLAEQALDILEFGVGASTQIFAAYGGGTVESVETDPAWIARTRGNLKKLGLGARAVAFFNYASFSPCGPYDVIFVDGVDELRRDFAFRTWPYLMTGGVMAFHDTRRVMPHGGASWSDVQNVCALLEKFSTEIDRVEFNRSDSNTTVVRKRAPLLYEDWNAVEGRTPEQIGIA